MRKITSSIAFVLLGVMLILIFTSAWNDSATMDELAHIPSGYSYLALKDYRLNPEHPPLMKDLAAVPLVFLHLNFPTDVSSWKNDINGQWDMGRIFLYESGNNADKIIHWSRFPIMLLAILFGWVFFRWVRRIYGDKVALLALFFFVFSPTFLAHSRYVTTDLAASFGFFIGIAAFLNFLFRQNKDNPSYSKKQALRSLIIAGIAFGVAQLLKFSLVLLAPLYVVFGTLWIFLSCYENFETKKFLKELFLMLVKIILVGLIGLVLIWLVYLYHTWNYPVERQVNDATYILKSFGIKPLVNFVIWLSGIPILRALGQYMLGVLMVLQRAAGGNTTYFVGEISAAGWTYYFPLLYFLKEQLAFHILTLIVIIFGLRNILKSQSKNLRSILEWLRENFVITAGLIFIAVYWLQAITSPLNIGVRHVLPTFPFIYLMVARQVVRWIKGTEIENPQTILEWLKTLYFLYIRPMKNGLLAAILLFWMIISVLITYPYFLSYYNILGGGTRDGYKIAADSNYDWGQDLKRLKDWVEETKIEKIAIDYFGGGNPQYYFGNKFEPWWSAKGPPADAGIKWFAISLTFLQDTHAKPVHNFTQKQEDTYPWLKGKTPVARAGTSIFIYKF